MKILFLTAYSELGASSRTRVYQYLPFLIRADIGYNLICFTPKWMHGLTMNHDGARKLIYYPLALIIKAAKSIQAIIMASQHDIIFIQKVILPFRLEKLLKLINPNIIFDFDDAIWKGAWQYRGAFNMMAAAKCCIVENEWNKNIAEQFCNKIEIITGPIDTDRYQPKFSERAFNPIIIGWAGSRSTIKYLYALENVLAKLAESTYFKLMISSSDLHFEMENGKFPWEICKWRSDREVEFIQNFDIGIMPLTDDEWTRGKGGYKLLEYMACGIPVVASPVGINSEIVLDGTSGILATTNDEWFNALSALVESKWKRQNMGLASRIRIENRYSLKKAADRLEIIFKAL